MNFRSAALLALLACPLGCVHHGATPLYGSDNGEPLVKDPPQSRAAADTAVPGNGTPPATAKPGGAMTKAPLGTGESSGSNVGGASTTGGNRTTPSTGGTGASGSTPGNTGASGGTSP